MTAHDVRLIAFYLPQYHPIPENDAWWGTGFTEWTMVARARPLFAGHYQPHLPADLGFYDLRVPEVRQAQADLAKQYGIYGFCYYHYWFNGKRLLGRPFDEVLASGQPDFPFCLCWANENWTRVWDGMGDHVLISQQYSADDDREHIRYLTKAFRDNRYIRIDGRPLFIVYRASQIPNPLETTSMWREEARKMGTGDLFLCRMESLRGEQGDPTKLGFDAAVEFQPDWMNLGTRLRDGNYGAYEDNHIEDYSALVRRQLQKNAPPYKRFPCVTPGWDNTPRRSKNATILRDATPELYGAWLQGVISRFVPYSRYENLIFVNAWNEWGEGAHLEPCQKWGRAFLDATARAVQGAWDSWRPLGPDLTESRSVTPPLQEVTALGVEEVGFTCDADLGEGKRSDLPAVKVSVCIPTYNGAKYVGEAIASVLAQTFGDFELIIVDDCSTDSTQEVIASFRDKRCRYFSNSERLGLPRNWNRCLELCRGQYVCIFHQDDVMILDNLERKVQVLESNPAVGFVYSEAFQIDSEGNQLSDRWIEGNPQQDCIRTGLEFFETSMLGTVNLVNCPSVVARRECYDQLGGFDTRLVFTADWEMWMRIALFYDVAFIAEPLVRYRWHASNETLKFRNNPDELREYYRCKTIAMGKYPERVPKRELLTLHMIEDYAQQALERALGECRSGRAGDAERYLVFALEAHPRITERDRWLQQALDRGGNEVAARQQLELPGDELAARAPMVALVAALCHKIAAMPGLGWLLRLRGPGNRLLVWTANRFSRLWQ